jgi:hypothetical protein
MTEIPNLIGLTLEEAIEKIAGKWKTRIRREDGQSFMHTNDARYDRLNFEIDEGKITKCYIG